MHRVQLCLARCTSVQRCALGEVWPTGTMYKTPDLRKFPFDGRLATHANGTRSRAAPLGGSSKKLAGNARFRNWVADGLRLARLAAHTHALALPSIASGAKLIAEGK